MHRIHTTAVKARVNDRQDRKNVVVVLRGELRRLCLFLREARPRLMASAAGLPWMQAMYAGTTSSPSWGGHGLSGGTWFRNR